MHASNHRFIFNTLRFIAAAGQPKGGCTGEGHQWQEQLSPCSEETQESEEQILPLEWKVAIDSV